MRIVAGVLAAVTLWSSGLVAQEKKDDEFARAVFAPELALKHARDIGVTAEQRRAIMDHLKEAQTELAPLQIDLTSAALELLDLLDQPRVDEAAALAKSAQVLRIENEVKRVQLALLIRIKNALTRDQQSRLRDLRDGRGGGGDRDGAMDGDASTESWQGLGGDR